MAFHGVVSFGGRSDSSHSAWYPTAAVHGLPRSMVYCSAPIVAVLRSVSTGHRSLYPQRDDESCVWLHGRLDRADVSSRSDAS